jgi:hypothetical protein
MLTPTEVHYVAGLLALTSSDAGVEVELGAMVYDEASKTVRDVDVVLRSHKADGTVAAVLGREVKAHGRPLGSDDVEQLVIKQKDMPDITNRSIVSASGYTQPAIDKAAFHGVELYELVELPASGNSFEHFRAENVTSRKEGPEWVGAPTTHLNPTRTNQPGDSELFAGNPAVHGHEDPACRDLKSYLERGRLNVLGQLIDAWPEADRRAGVSKRARLTLRFDAPRAYVKAPYGDVPIDEIVYTGEVRWRIDESKAPFYVLRKVGAEKPDAGCAVFEGPANSLCGVMVSNSNRDIRFAHIPVVDRERKKIYRQVLQSGNATKR